MPSQLLERTMPNGKIHRHFPDAIKPFLRHQIGEYRKRDQFVAARFIMVNQGGGVKMPFKIADACKLETQATVFHLLGWGEEYNRAVISANLTL